MNGIKLSLLAAIVLTASFACGQQPPASNFAPSNSVPREKPPLVFSPAVPAQSSTTQPAQSLPQIPMAPVFQQAVAVPQPAPAIPVRQIAQNAVTQHHRLKLAAQSFEKNLLEKLGSRFVPVRSVENDPQIAKFQLPVKDGTAVELVINRQHNMVAVTGSPKMVDSCLQIVRALDTEEQTGTITQFVPVQQSNAQSAQRIANILNQETRKVAQNNPVPQNLPQGVADQLAGSVLGPVNIQTVDDLGTMIIQGSPRDVAVIQGLLEQLRTLSQESEPIIELVAMKHANSVQVYQLVQQLYAQIYLARRGVVTMLPLVKPNTIMLIGRQDSINSAKELIAKLDTPVHPNAAFRIFPLKYAASDTLANQINQAFQSRPGYGTGLAPMVNVVSDYRTNALIVQASPRDIQEAAEMIKQLDVPGSAVTTLVRSFQLKNAVAADLATVLQNAFSENMNQQRTSMLTLGKVDEQGNLVRSDALYNVSVVADTRSNSLLVTAPPDTMPLIESLIEQLDQLPSAESRIRVFTLVNASAYDLTTLLTNIFSTGTGTGGGFGGGAQTSQIATVRPGTEPGESTLVSVQFQTDIRTNSIVAIGSEGDLAVAEALLLRLDAENLDNRKIFTMKLINTPAEELAPILETYFSNERQIDIQNSTTLLPQSPLEQYRKEVNIVAEPISNSLIITTTQRYYEQIRRVIEELDERPQMVAIQVLIAEISITNARDRGMELGLQDSILFDRALDVNPTFPGLSAGNPTVGVNAGSLGSQGITSLIPGDTNRATGAGGFSFSASSESVSILIRALETRRKVQVLSRPNLVTLHNQRATIFVGEDIPYAEATDTANVGRSYSTQFVNLGTTLDITPRIMPDGMISMAVYARRSSLIEFREIAEGQQAPYSKATEASTSLNAMDGQTVIFAGLITETKDSQNRSIPFINRIPLVKYLFEYDSKSKDRSELMIVLTPTIIRSREDLEILNQQERERVHWCITDVVDMMGDAATGGMRLRSDEWTPNEVPHSYGEPIQLKDSQLPKEQKMAPIVVPMLEK